MTRSPRSADVVRAARSWSWRTAGWLGLAWVRAAGAGEPITALIYTPDGSELLSNGAGRLTGRSPTNGAVKREMVCDLRKISTLAFQPQGTRLAVAGGTPGVSGEVRLLDWPTGTGPQRLTNFTDVVTSVAFSSDGRLLAGASADHSIQVWSVTAAGVVEGKRFGLVGHAGPVLAVTFSPRGNQIVSAAADRSIKVWTTDVGRLFRTLTQHTEPIHALAFRPAEPGAPFPDIVASAGEDRTVRVWQPELGRLVRIIRGHSGPILALAYAPDGLTLFSAGQDGRVRQFDAASDQLLSEGPEQGDWIYSLAVSPDGHWLASGDWAGQVRVWGLPWPPQKAASPPR